MSTNERFLNYYSEFGKFKQGTKLIPRFQGGSYIVKAGDTLSKIAKSHNMSLQQLLSLNKNIKDPSKINVGQKITVSASANKPSTQQKALPRLTDGNSTVQAAREWGESTRQQAKERGQKAEVRAQQIRKKERQRRNNSVPKNQPVVKVNNEEPVSKSIKSDNTSNENFKRFVGNMIKDPITGVTDATLWALDRVGVPSNATNYLRDFNISFPYRTKASVQALLTTPFNGKSLRDNYNNALANPGFLTRMTTINPLINTEKNFNQEQLDIIKQMAGDKNYINNSDIKRVGGKYGAAGSVFSYFTPVKVVQTALGQTSGHDGVLTDLFDVNTQSDEAKHDNQMYLRMALENPGFNYQTLRATMPFLNMIDIMPDQYKIQSKVRIR